ncbi:MAG: hypothetical protein HYT42_01915 [Candidatus Sungbacteria bacterium]|nr:hypothetical protein [Candidatus Sungbacteria bacterium]
MTPEDINNFFSFLYEGRAGEIVYWLRLAAGIFTSAFLAGIFAIAWEIRRLDKTPYHPLRGPSRPEAGVDPLYTQWQEVNKKLESNNPTDWNFAVIRADSAFDSVLKEKGVSGETMGERLKNLDLLPLNTLNNVWEAHKIRNRIAHETDHVLTYEEARRAVRYFEEALKEMR